MPAFLTAIALTAAFPAQTAAPAPQQAAPAPAAAPKDVASIDAILGALYGVISGDPGVQRDWDRFRSLFHPSARLIPTGVREGKTVARAIGPEDYIRSSGPYPEREGFHEVEIARRVDRFGHIAQVFSTYESRHKLGDAMPFMRGINSIQLFNDGTRWWVLSITWTQESPQFPIPEAYLKSPG